MSRTITTTTAIPEYISTGHYRMASASTPGKVYDLHYNFELKRWECNCPDANPEKGNNPNCKHRRHLVACIKERMEENKAQREATAISQHASLLEEQIQGMQLAMAEQAEMIRELAAKVEKLAASRVDPEREAWAEFEQDPAAGRARQAAQRALLLQGRVDQMSANVETLRQEVRSVTQGNRGVASRREAALNGNQGFSLERR